MFPAVGRFPEPSDGFGAGCGVPVDPGLPDGFFEGIERAVVAAGVVVIEAVEVASELLVLRGGDVVSWPALVEGWQVGGAPSEFPGRAQVSGKEVVEAGADLECIGPQQFPCPRPTGRFVDLFFVVRPDAEVEVEVRGMGIHSPCPPASQLAFLGCQVLGHDVVKEALDVGLQLIEVGIEGPMHGPVAGEAHHDAAPDDAAFLIPACGVAIPVQQGQNATGEGASPVLFPCCRVLYVQRLEEFLALVSQEPVLPGDGQGVECPRASDLDVVEVAEGLDCRQVKPGHVGCDGPIEGVLDEELNGVRAAVFCVLAGLAVGGHGRHGVEEELLGLSEVFKSAGQGCGVAVPEGNVVSEGQGHGCAPISPALVGRLDGDGVPVDVVVVVGPGVRGQQGPPGRISRHCHCAG